MHALAAARRSEVAGSRRATHRQLGGWLEGAEGRSLQEFAADGVYDGEWLSEAVVGGKRLSILGGRLARPRQIVEVISEALEGTQDASWTDDTRREFMAALRVGELVADRARLAVGTLADHSLGGDIALPHQATLQRMARAVTLDRALLKSERMDCGDLAGLTQRLTLRLSRADAGESVMARPLSSANGDLILVAPAQLTGAAIDRVWADAESVGARERFIKRVRSCTEVRVETLLRRLGLQPHGEWCAGGRRFRFDSDKLAYVAIVCDGEPTGLWSGQRDLERIVDEFRRLQSSADEVKYALAVTVSAAGYIGYDLHSEADLLVLALDELEVVADAHRGEPLLLWHLLSEPDLASLMRRGDIGGLDIIGHADRLYEMSRIVVSQDPAFDAAEELLSKARDRSGRRAAPDPDISGRWLTVVRPLDAGGDNVFEPAGARDERIELFVSCRGQQGWVRAPAGASRCEPTSAVVQLATRWLSVIWDQVEFLCLKRPGRWLVEVAWDEQQPDRIRMETSIAPGGAPVTNLIAGPSLLAALSQLDNSGDREVVREALTGWLLGCGAGPAAEPAAAEAVDRIIPAGSATLLVWAANGERLMSERLPPAPAISDACTYRIRSEIADRVRRDYAPGAYESDQARDVLNLAVRASAEAIQTELARLGTAGVYALVDCHERALTDELHRGLALPTRAALFGRESVVDEYLADASEEARRTLGLRFLVEHATAMPSHGPTLPSDATLERLRMLADFLLDGAGLSDAMWKDLATARLLLPDAGPLGISASEELNNAQWAQINSWNVDAPERHQALTRQLLRPSLGEDDPSRAEIEDEWRGRLDESWERTHGFTQLDMARVCSKLIAAAYDQPDHLIALPEESVVALGAQASGVAPEATRRVVSALVLEPPGDYDPFAIDYRPWRLRRTWSLVWRPIVRWDSEDGERLLWGAETLAKHGLYRTRMEQNGYGIDDPAIQDVPIQLRQARDRDFNNEVARESGTIKGAAVRARVTKIGGARILLDRKDIGDIDVLVVLRSSGCVLALETKNLLPALNPYAIAHERERLAGPGGAIELHSRRIRWLRDNRAAITREFGNPTTSHWRVEGAIVVPTPLTTAFLPDVAMPILAASQVATWAQHLGGVPRSGLD